SCIAKTSFDGTLSPRFMRALPYNLDHFLAGMLLADLYSTEKASPRQPSFAWDVLGTCAWIGIIASQQTTAARHALPLLTIVAYLGVFRGIWLRYFCSLRWITIIGGMCYTLYLNHFYVISFVSKVTIPRLHNVDYMSALLLQCLLILPLTFLLGAVLFALIERPFMIWRPFRSRPATATPVPESSVVSGSSL
ncbi:MAG: hypothetical protein KDA58_10645, partial [Planctomycetaceae bacterium]|nr:hypothetical protein [Planctomycetaceae bacterium]